MTDLLRKENIEDVYPMSDIQLGMVYHSLKEPEAFTYHNQVVYQRRDEDFSSEILAKALALMVGKHPILRTGFNMYGFKEPIQIVFKEVLLNLNHYDLSHMNRQAQEEYIRVVSIEDRRKSFNVSTPELLWRMYSFVLDKKNVFFLWSCHHGITDGWSTASLMTELNQIYLRLKADPHYVPEKLKNTYKQFVLEQRLEKENKTAIEFWRNELTGYKRLEFPVNRTAENQPPQRKIYGKDLGNDILKQLNQCTRKYNTSLKNLCFAAYLYMLNMLSHDTDIVAGLVTSNRPVCEDGDKIIGCFLNTVPVRIKIPDTITWADFIVLVERKLLDLADYNRLSLMEIVNIVGVKNRAQNPIFDTLFNFVDFYIYSQDTGHDEKKADNGEAKKKLSVGGNEVTNTLFNCDVITTGGHFWVLLTYLESTITDEMVERVYGYYERILDRLIYEPEGIAGKEELLSSSEKRRVLEEFNRTGTPFPDDKTIYELFEKQALGTPDSVAVVGSWQLVVGNNEKNKESLQLSYKELNKKSDQLAHVLREKGVLADDIVGIMVERSDEMIIGILGILKAGGAYLPIDPGYPEERKQYMLADSGARILLTNFFEGHHIHHSSFITHHSGNLAYVIYTSGSTGRPKGVMIEHRSLVNRLNWMQKTYPLDETDTVLQKTPFTFDVSVWELLWWSIVGARICFLVPGGEKDPAVMVDTIETHNITILHFVPSMLTLFLDYVETAGATRQLSGLKQVIASGEALSLSQVKRFNELLYRLNNTKLANLYGPTEASIDVSYFDCSPGEELELVPIGKPIDNTRFYVLSKSGQLQPAGAAGELYIAGIGLARGYLNRPELTTEKFLFISYRSYKSYRTYSSKKVYKTGDKVRWLPGGNLEFISRIDHQVKIRGNRIELGEIEARLVEHNEIKEAAVTYREVDGGGDKCLVAYIVSDKEFEVSGLREHLLKKLPDYMVPTHFKQIDRIPLTANGKLDRASLDSYGRSISIGQEHVDPTTEMEKTTAQLWKEVLKVDKVGIYDNFFDLGGDSVKVIKLNSRLNNAFGMNIPVAKMFHYLTIRSFVEYLNRKDREKDFSDNEEVRAAALDRGKQKRQEQRAKRRKVDRINV